MNCSLRFYGDGISFWLVLANHSDSESFLVVHILVQPRWMPQRRILGGGQTCGVSFWPFPNSSGWWWLISSVFLTRTSCHKTAHANGYCGAWPGCAVPVSVLPSQFHCGFIGQAAASYIPWVKFHHNLCWLDLQAENDFYYFKCYEVLWDLWIIWLPNFSVYKDI